MKLEDVYQFAPNLRCPFCAKQGVSLFFGVDKRLVQISCSPDLHTFDVFYAPGASMPYARMRLRNPKLTRFESDEPTQQELKECFSDVSIYEGDIYPLPIFK